MEFCVNSSDGFPPLDPITLRGCRFPDPSQRLSVLIAIKSRSLPEKVSLLHAQVFRLQLAQYDEVKSNPPSSSWVSKSMDKSFFVNRRDHQTGSFLVLTGLIWSLCISGLFAQTLQEPLPIRDLPRFDLLKMRDEQGGICAITDQTGWAKRRSKLLESMTAIMGKLPGEDHRCDFEIQVDEEVDCGSYVRRLIRYQSEPGCHVPAYLCIPKRCLMPEAESAPAVLCLHPTDNRVGHQVVLGIAGRPNRQYAAELAERGYVTLAPSYPLLAKYHPDIRELGWESGTLKAVWDNQRGLDLLESLPFVDARRFAAIGHSLGGHNSVYTAVFDPRIEVVVSSCGLDAYTDYYQANPGVWMPEKGWCQLRYIPKLADYRGRLEEIPFDFPEMVAALAPRKVLIIAPLNDGNFRADSVDRVVASARQVYKLWDAEDALQVVHPDCDHDFPDDMRELAYRTIDSVLKSP